MRPVSSTASLPSLAFNSRAVATRLTIIPTQPPGAASCLADVSSTFANSVVPFFPFALSAITSTAGLTAAIRLPSTG